MSSFLADEIREARSKGHTNLYLNYHRLSEIPQDLLELSKIKRLYLRRNSLKKLPADIWKLGELVELHLDSNILKELPEEIGRLALLHNLNVSNNFLKSLTPAVGQLKSLTSLNLANNELTLLPKELGTLPHLKVLNVANNKLRWLPWQLCECSSLETLAFDRNAVQRIPHQLMSLNRLTEISASGNKLSFIPQDVNFLIGLKSLLLDNNSGMCFLPANLLKMENLQTIGLNRPDKILIGLLLSTSCGENLQRGDICELKQVLDVKHILGLNHNAVLTLLESALRTVYQLIHSARNVSSLLIPSHLSSVLEMPTGHCFDCHSPYFTAVFPLVEDATTGIQISRPSSQTLQRLRDTRFSFVFSCCSFSCLVKVRDIRDRSLP